MPRNTLQDLRDHLFETLEDLKEHPDKPVDAEQLRLKIEKAKAVSQVSSAIIDTARLELKAHEQAGKELTGNFFPESEDERAERTRKDLNLHLRLGDRRPA